MDRVPDGGVGWRRTIGEWLRRHGVITLDPTDKPTAIGNETPDDRMKRHVAKQAGEFDKIAKEMKVIRCVDLRMVDLSDFLIVNLDLEIHACGTYEELFWANRCKKPIIIHIEQGKETCPDWLLGTIPHQHIFSAWFHVHDYLRQVDSGELDLTNERRWYFFDYDLPTYAA
jgi:hypothetical protein